MIRVEEAEQPEGVGDEAQFEQDYEEFLPGYEPEGWADWIAPSSAPAVPTPAPGDRVRLRGMRRHVELEGRHGIVLDPSTLAASAQGKLKPGDCMIRMDDGKLAGVKMNYLELVTDGDEAGEPDEATGPGDLHW